MTTKFTKASPKYVHYRNYKNFNKQDYKLELRGKLEVYVVDINYETFDNIYLNVLNKHAPIKAKEIRGNQEHYITKAYRETVMRRSELKAKYLKNSTLENFNKFRKQKNVCYRLYKKDRRKVISFGLLLDIKFPNLLKQLLLKEINQYQPIRILLKKLNYV